MARRRISGACQRCDTEFAGGQVVTIVLEDIAFGLLTEGRCIGVTEEWVAVCDACATPAEAAEAEYRRDCRGCGQPMLTPHYDDGADSGRLRLKVCSNRCLQRWRRVLRARRRPHATCPVCKFSFRPSRADARYCSNACRQWAYRLRASGGDTVESMIH